MSADPTLPAPNTPPDVPTPPPPAAAAPPLRRKRPLIQRLLTGRHYDDQVVVYRHSHLFYWWPVWLLGFIFAAVSYFGDQHVAVVPAHTEAAEHRKVQVLDADGEMKERERNVLILPEGKKLRTRKDDEGHDVIIQPTIYLAPHRSIGTIYLFVLLLVIVLTNISLRGLWSLLVLMTLVLLAIILYLLPDVWRMVFHNVGQLSIYMNMGGYLLISIVLFSLWAFNFFILDRMTYMIFTPGQVRVRLTIGGGETVYSAANMTLQKQRADMFRHWGLGFGSGDLLVWPASSREAIDLPNVLRVGSVVHEIERMLKETVIVSADRT